MYCKEKWYPMLCFMLVIGFCNPITSIAQDSDEGNIEQAIEDYIVGWRTANKELLRKTFDMDAGVVLWVDKKGESELLRSMTLAELVDVVKVQEGYGIGYKIQNLEIIDSQLAIAMVKIPIRDSYYIDCLELQKINDSWRIVLKSFVYFKGKGG